MKKLLLALLLYPLICNAENVEIDIENCTGKVINTIGSPLPYPEKSILEVSGENNQYRIQFIEKIDENYRLKINLSRIDKKGSTININTELLVSKNQRIQLGGYCSNQANSGEQYFLTVK